jgi:phosphoribosylformylglycinamidine synthase
VLDLEAEAALQGFLVEAAASGLLLSAHDASDGGLACALAEACFSGPGVLGIDVDLRGAVTPGGREIRPDALLFGESASRVVVSVSPANVAALEKLARARGVPFHVSGSVGGEGSEAVIRVRAGSGVLVETAVADLRRVWENAFAGLMGELQAA